MISQQWKSLSPEERQRWEDLAKEKKKEHEQMYPNYVYRPQRSKAAKGKKGKGRKASTEGEQDTDPETYSCLLPVSLPSASSSSSSNRQGRARSAPTPPLTYQTIHIPTVYMPSCPPSPTLRSHRTPLPKHSLDRNAPARMTYIPDDTLMPPPFSQSPYDPHLENNEMFQGMFDLPGQNVPINKNNSLPSLSIPQTESMLSPNNLVSPTSTFDAMSPASPEDGAYSPLTGFSHTQSLDGALGFVPQVDGNCYGQSSFMDYPSYGWGNAEWQNVSEIGSSNEYDLDSIPAVELSVPDYGQLPVAEQGGEFCPPAQQQTNENELFTGMFSYNNEHMMWS